MYKNNNQKIVAIIEARMNSSRLPGKVLLDLAGSPSLKWLIIRLKKSEYVDEIVLATTVNEGDDILEAEAKRLEVSVFRGSEEDVMSRVLGAAIKFRAHIIVSITGDCPLVDHKIVDRGIEEFYKNDVDYVSNVLELSYPIGFDVQVYPRDILEDAARRTDDPIDRVHVTLFIYSHPELYKLHNFSATKSESWPGLRLTLDEQADYKLLNEIFEKLLPINYDFSAKDVVDLLRSNPYLVTINKSVRKKEIHEG